MEKRDGLVNSKYCLILTKYALRLAPNSPTETDTDKDQKTKRVLSLLLFTSKINTKRSVFKCLVSDKHGEKDMFAHLLPTMVCLCGPRVVFIIESQLELEQTIHRLKYTHFFSSSKWESVCVVVADAYITANWFTFCLLNKAQKQRTIVQSNRFWLCVGSLWTPLKCYIKLNIYIIMPNIWGHCNDYPAFAFNFGDKNPNELTIFFLAFAELLVKNQRRPGDTHSFATQKWEEQKQKWAAEIAAMHGAIDEKCINHKYKNLKSLRPTRIWLQHRNLSYGEQRYGHKR